MDIELVKKRGNMTTPIIACAFCKNLFLNNKKNCKAFPNINGIPEDILIGENSHTKIYPGQDNDIVFEKLKEE